MTIDEVISKIERSYGYTLNSRVGLADNMVQLTFQGNGKDVLIFFLNKGDNVHITL